MSDRAPLISPLLYNYLVTQLVHESPVLQALREQTAKMSMRRMQISPDQGQFLAFLVGLIDAKKTLDIGVFTGYSALWVAEALPPDGKVIGCDINAEWTKLAQRFWQEAGVSHKIDLRLAPALETLNQLVETGESETFDFAFIDADKVNYLAYYELVLKLLRKNGVVAIDNVLWKGKVADLSIMDRDTVAIRELNEFVVQDKRVSCSIVSMGDGVLLARKI